jgi:hypothetical protein
MMVSVHAAVGAMLGAGIEKPGAALAGGVASHLLCDLVPHKDYDIQIEAPLALAMFGYLAWRFGIRSPQFWGAVGAVLPDAENALALLGVIPESKTVFPTHNKSASWFVGHGKTVESPIPQAALALIALLLADGRR